MTLFCFVLPGQLLAGEMIDVSNPANPQRVGAYDTGGAAVGVAVSGNYAYVTERLWTGSNYVGSLHVIDVRNPANPQRVGGYDTGGAAVGVAVSGNYAYVADGTNGLQVIDVSNPDNPQRVGGTSVRARGVAVSGSYAYVVWTGSNYVGSLQVIDISDPANPQWLGGHDTSGEALGMTVSGNYAYVADGSAGLQVIDVSNPANPQPVGAYDTSVRARDVAVSGNYAYVVGGDVIVVLPALGAAVSGNYAWLEVFDISNPASARRVGGYYATTGTGVANAVAVSGKYAYVADYRAGLEVIDVSNPTQPRRVGGNSAFEAVAVTVAGTNVFVTAGEQGLMILDLFRAPLRLEPVSPPQSGAFRFLLHGEAGLSVRVQRSSNLRDWEDWQPVTLAAGPAELTDSDAGPYRLYRAVYP